MWTDNIVRKPSKVVVTLRRGDQFIDKVNIPTVMWPLNGSYEVFTSANCSIIPEDSDIRTIVDSIPYRIGRCYSNSERVAQALREKGYKAPQYAGWMFYNEVSHPMHHAWVIVDNHLIDLSDEWLVTRANADHFRNTTEAGKRELHVDFVRWLHQYPNSVRTAPFGVPSGNLLYVGCECGREKAIQIYCDLIAAYPNHPAAKHARPGELTKMQKLLAENGLF